MRPERVMYPPAPGRDVRVPHDRYPTVPKPVEKDCPFCAVAGVAEYPKPLDLRKLRKRAEELKMWRHCAALDLLRRPLEVKRVDGCETSGLTAEQTKQLVSAGLMRVKAKKEGVRAVVKMFTIVKKCAPPNCERRLLMDGRRVSEAMLSEKVDMDLPSLEQFRAFVLQCEGTLYATGMDFKSWFYQFRWPACGLGVRVRHDGAGNKFFLFQGLPMGIRDSPGIAQCGAEVLGRMSESEEEKGAGEWARVFVFIDDVVIVGPSRPEVERQTVRFKQGCEEMEATLSSVKEQALSTKVTWGGVEWDLKVKKARVKQSWAEEWSRFVGRVLKEERMELQVLQQVLGGLGWWLRVHDRIWCEYVEAYKWLCRVGGEAKGVCDWDVKLKKELEGWCEELHKNRWEELRRDGELGDEEPEVLLVSDASTTGWGSMWYERTKDGDWRSMEVSWGMWEEEHQAGEMQCLELLAVEHGLRCFMKRIKGKVVGIVGDSVSALWAIKNGRTRTVWGMEITRRIRVSLSSERWVLKWTGTGDMPADKWSRKGGRGYRVHVERWRPALRRLTEVQGESKEGK